MRPTLGRKPYGLNMEGARRIVTNTWSKRRIKPEQILLAPQVWATLDYDSVTEPDVRRRDRLDGSIVREPRTAWSCGSTRPLAEGIRFSNAPGEPELIYGNAYFPLSQPVPLDSRRPVTVALHADLVGDDYIWRWNTRVLGQGNAERIKANFRQSTLAGTPLSPQQLRRRADIHVAKLNENGAITHAILERMARGMRNDEISREVAGQFPHRFRTWQDALAEVGEIATKYST